MNAPGDGVLCAIWVPGIPKTKGSLTFRGGRHVEESVAGSPAWRRLVASAARDDRHARQVYEPYGGPVRVRALFVLPVDPVKPRAGDVDKLSRNVLDALSADRAREVAATAAAAVRCAGVYADDNQVTELVARKTRADPRVVLGPSQMGMYLVVDVDTDAARVECVSAMLSAYGSATSRMRRPGPDMTASRGPL